MGLTEPNIFSDTLLNLSCIAPFCSFIFTRIKPATRAYFQLLRKASAFGRGFFCPSGKKRAYYTVLAHFGIFCSPIITLVTFSSNISNNNKKTIKIQKNSKKFKKFQKIPKSKKLSKYQEKSKNNPKIQKKTQKPKKD